MYYYNPPPKTRGPLFGFHVLKRILICMTIAVVVLLAKRCDAPVAKSVVSKVGYVVSDWHFEPQRIFSLAQVLFKDGEVSPVFIPDKQHDLELPVEGTLSSPFGRRWHPVLKEYRMHQGVDIAAPEGSPVKAVLKGMVLETAIEPELGKVIRLQHPEGITSVYAHLNEVFVRTGDDVTRGFIIGSVGKTGLAQAPHLHFEFWEGDRALDPEKWLDIP